MLTLSQLQNKRIVVLGLGLTGMSFVRFLTNNALTFAVNDSRVEHAQFRAFSQNYPAIELIIGGWNKALIASADILLVSPGVDITEATIADHISSSCQVWGDIELYARLKDTPVVAITGSNGKSTVVTLLDHLAQAIGVTSQLAGNIGMPILDTLDKSPELLILELSSFQLETIVSLKPKVSCILNVSDDHLDRHKTMQVYGQLKQRIYQHAEFAVYNFDDKATKPPAHLAQVSFSQFEPKANTFGLINSVNGKCLANGQQALIALNKLSLSGAHNATNCLAVLAIGQALGWSMMAMLGALPHFDGLAHRCQQVASNDNIFWFNDSKATNVGATVAAIKGLAPTLSTHQKLILIAGGESKGADFSPLKQVIDHHVSQLIALGKDKNKLLALTDKGQAVESIEQAVAVAKQHAIAGDMVLLSPACASIDMFPNFVARGEAFIAAVNNVKEAS